ncbi:carboxypeptidase-like regulatory domain-containing protein [Aquimarina algiphila]|uniref:carboxypeptidase-like regulatory domain-containing protein n=1 Tax=Aquimarina algiphila TaxID=2047982 RepID=UPI00232B07C3|nr:carboxypeptidase-like regulatory domain-containing protein [Aquimarina algiphila]
MRFLIRIIFFFGLTVIYAQDNQPKVSLSFDNVNLKNAFSQIEEVTNYRFYYVDAWLGDKIVSGKYENTPLNEVLEDIFKDTILNFFISNKKGIIITRNSVIYDELPKGFFGNEKKETVDSGEEIKVNPVFQIKDGISKKRRAQTIRIGRENKNSDRSSFTLEGYAINSRTGAPVSNLSIIVKNKNTGTDTDKNGYYEIELSPGLNILEISAMGVANQTKRIIIYNDGELDFNLEESLEVLDEVIIESNVNENVKSAITGAEKVDVEESKNIPLVLGERDVLKVATTLPGVTTAGEGAVGFNVRGGKSDQNLILLDDAVVYNPQHFFGVFSALNPFTLGEVNIYKGSIPAEYGGRLSSVFDIKTRDSDAKEFKGEASIGPVTGNVVLETPVFKDKSALMVGGRVAYANWILRSLDEENLQNSEASFYDVVAKYNHKFNENNKISATGYFSRDDFSITSDSLYIYKNRALSLNWEHKFNEKNRGNLIVVNSAYEFDIEFDGDTNGDFKLGNSIEETELKLKMKYLYSDRLKFDYGISSKLYALRPGNKKPDGAESIVTPVNVPKERGLESAAFLSGKFDVTKKLLLDAGIRFSVFNTLGESSQRIYQEGLPKNDGTLIETREFDKNEVVETYGGPELRLSARYLILPDFSVKASYNNTIQYIHRLSNNTTASPIDTWKLSDLNIEPQRANQYSIGLYKNFNQNAYELSLEGFYKRLDKILDFKTGAQTLLNQNIETEVLQGDGKSYGAEFLIRKNKGKFNGWLAYTYSRSFIKLDSPFREEQVNDGDFFPSNFDRPHDISMVTNYKFTRRFSLSANFVYQTGRPVTFPIGNFNFNNSEFVVYSDRNKFRIPDFYRLDIGFNVEGNHKKGKVAHSFWTISIYNVLGRNNPFSVFFVTDEGEIKGLQSSIFSVPVPSITYSFKF